MKGEDFIILNKCIRLFNHVITLLRSITMFCMNDNIMRNTLHIQTKCEEYYAKYCQSYITLLWTLIMLWLTIESTRVKQSCSSIIIQTRVFWCKFLEPRMTPRVRSHMLRVGPHSKHTSFIARMKPMLPVHSARLPK